MKVALLGATAKHDRYAYQALELLLELAHEVYPVHPKIGSILGQKVYASLAAIPDEIDTLTLYVGEARSSLSIEEILALRPKRIIFNPGAENPVLYERARSEGIVVMNACTLVLLKTGQFEHR